MKKSLITLVLISGAALAAERPFASSGATNNAPKPATQVAPQVAGQGEQHQRPDPAQRVTQMMTSSDANKDGVLSQDELTQALVEMQKNRPQRPQQGGQSSGAPAGAQPGQQASAQGGAQGEQRHEPPAADKMAAQMIEKYSSSKTGLTAAELTKALEEQRGQHGGGQRGQGGERPARPEQK